MKKVLPWLGLGLLAASFGGSSFACSSDDSSGGGATGGSGGGFTDGGFGATGGGTGATGGATGGSGGGPAATKLGLACTGDAECGTGLTCILPDSGAWDGEGPAHGYCSATCTTPDECKPHGATAECVGGFCFGGCTVGTPFGPDKCQQRADVGCNVFLRSATKGACGAGNTCPTGELCGTDNMCHDSFGACDPRCGQDSDCPTGHSCNPSTGLCTTQAVTGKDLGLSCKQTPTGQPSECKGFCVGITPSTERFCSNLCVLGAPGCGFTAPGVKSDGICSLVFDLGGASPTTGDIGACAALCDCNAECPSGYICEASANATQAGRAGSCSPTADPEAGAGIASCSDAGTDAGTGGTDAGTGGTDAGTGGTGTGGTGTGGTGTGGAPADAGNG